MDALNDYLPTEGHDTGLGHVLTRSTYRRTLFALLLLTMITVGITRFDFGALNIVVAIVVASCKALLVGLFFMHLRYEKKLIIFFALYPLLLLALLIGGTLEDVVTREEVAPLIRLEHGGSR
jgi:cytochrome c oxidase subunit IV